MKKHARDLVAVGIRKRAQQHAVDHAEDGAISADAESQRQHDDDGERGIGAQHAAGVAQVSQEILDIAGVAHVAALLLNLCKTAQLAHSRATRFSGRHAGG